MRILLLFVLAGTTLSLGAGAESVVSSIKLMVATVDPLQESFSTSNPPILSKAYGLLLAVSDVYAVATCRSKEGSAFNFCVNHGDEEAESGDCRTKHVRPFSTRRLVVALKGTELCNRNPLVDTVKLLVFGDQSGARRAGAGEEKEMSCFIPISPYRAYNSTVRVPGRSLAHCTVSVEENLSPFRLIATLSGLAIIILAPALSRSLPFRVGLGALFAVVFAVVLAIYYLSKRPRATAMGSILLGVAALNQKWWRSSVSTERMQQLVALYCLASACGGAAVSYYFDSAFSSDKAVSIISCAFQVAGSLLIYATCQSSGLTATAISAAFSLHILSLDVVAKVVFNRRVVGFGRRALASVASPQLPSASQGGDKVRSPANRVLEIGSSEKREKTPAKSKPFSPVSPQRSGPRRQRSASSGALRSPSASPPPPPTREPLQEASTSVSPLSSLTRRIGQALLPLSPLTPKQSPAVKTEDGPQKAHCVTQGLIVNEETNRLIGIGKGTYNKLVSQGWEVNEKMGVISPPSKKK